MTHNRLAARLVAALVVATSAGLTACDSPVAPASSTLASHDVVRSPTMERLAAPQANAVPEFDWWQLLVALDMVKAANPGLDEHDPRFARLLLSEIEAENAEGVRYWDPETTGGVNPAEYGTWSRLSSDERSLLLTHPWNILATKRAADQASATAASWYPSELYQGRGDALRHTYWNVLLSECCGVSWANDFTTAHESLSPPGDDRTMDLNNNAAGRAIFSSAGSAAARLAAILAYPLACVSSGATFDPSRIIYIVNCPTIRVFDDGPSFDDTFDVSLDATRLGTTPNAGGKTFETRDVRSGTHTLTVTCTVDGTSGGCGSEVSLANHITFTDGSQATGQMVTSLGGSYRLGIVFPTLGSRGGPRIVLTPGPISLPAPPGSRP